MIFLNSWMFLRSSFAIALNTLQGMNEVEMAYSLYIHHKYLKNEMNPGLSPKHIDVKLATDNWIEVSENVKPMEASEIVTIKKSGDSSVRDPIHSYKVTTSGPDGLYSYFCVNVPEFKQLLEQENTNKGELKSVVQSYLLRDKVPDIFKKEIEHVMDNNMNNEETKEYLTKKNCEFNAFMNINNICKMNNIDPKYCEFYFFIHGPSLDGKRFIYTDIIYIKKRREEVDCEIVPVFDEEKKVVVPKSKKKRSKVTIVVGSILIGIVFIGLGIYLKFRKKHKSIGEQLFI